MGHRQPAWPASITCREADEAPLAVYLDTAGRLHSSPTEIAGITAMPRSCLCECLCECCTLRDGCQEWDATHMELLPTVRPGHRTVAAGHCVGSTHGHARREAKKIFKS